MIKLPFHFLIILDSKRFKDYIICVWNIKRNAFVYNTVAKKNGIFCKNWSVVRASMQNGQWIENLMWYFKTVYKRVDFLLFFLKQNRFLYVSSLSAYRKLLWIKAVLIGARVKLRFDKGYIYTHGKPSSNWLLYTCLIIQIFSLKL